MAAAFTRVPVILHGFYDAITYGVGNLLVAVFFGENRLEKFDLYFFPWAGEDAAFGQGIQGSFDGYRNDRDVEFATQYGKGLFKLTNVAGNRTGAFGKNNQVFLVAQDFCQFLNGFFQVLVEIHHNYIVLVGQKANKGSLYVLGFGVEVGLPDLTGRSKEVTKRPSKKLWWLGAMMQGPSGMFSMPLER